MNATLKSITFFIGMLCINVNIFAESNPHKFIDSQAQAMVAVIRSNQDLYDENPKLFKDKINAIFEPMVDFRRVGASVMGKKYYLSASKKQRVEFINSFRNSLLDTYSSTLAQWGDQKIETIFPEIYETKKTIDFIGNNKKPFFTLNDLAKKAVSSKIEGEGNTAGYFFWETANGFHFKSIDSMLSGNWALS